MLKLFMTSALTLLFLFTIGSTEATAATKKKKYVSHYSKSSKKRKSSKRYKTRRHTGSSVDLKALTTESPYTENSDNGVNSIETKPGIH